MEFISCIKDLLSLRFNHAFAQINSLLWIITHPHIIIKRRSIIKKIRKVTDEQLLRDIILNNSIVYQYFIKQNRKYQSL